MRVRTGIGESASARPAGRASRRRRRGGPPDQGASIVDLVLALAMGLCLITTAVPMTATAVDAMRLRQAAGFVAARAHQARLAAIHTGRSTALAFDLGGGRWQVRRCEDGNGNGMRRADIAAGVDPCPEGPFDLADDFPGVAIAVDPAIPSPGGGAPPGSPVVFGTSRLVSFSPDGTCTSGSLYLRSPAGVQYAIRISGVAGRLRVLRYDAPARRWVDGS